MRTREGYKIAGHVFDVWGYCVNGTDCPIRWYQIRDFTKANIGQSGIAHIGQLTSEEGQSIEDERAREEQAFSDATYAAGAGGGGGHSR